MNSGKELRGTALFVSDAHADPQRLRSLLRLAESVGRVETRVFLGDAVGYGSDPQGVLDIIRNFDILVKGNHEAYLLGQEARWLYSRSATDSLQKHATMLRPEDLALIKSFVMTARLGPVFAFHGTPDRVGDYPFNEIDVRDILERFPDKDIFIGGHLHIPRLAMFHRRSGEIKFEEPLVPMSFHELDTIDFRYFVNCPSATPGRGGYTNPGCVMLEPGEPFNFTLQFLFLEAW